MTDRQTLETFVIIYLIISFIISDEVFEKRSVHPSANVRCNRNLRGSCAAVSRGLPAYASKFAGEPFHS